MLLGRAGQRPRHGVHAAAREVDPGDRVEVGDDRVDGQRVVRREAGVHRLEGEDPAGTRVAEELVDLRSAAGRNPPVAEQPEQVGG